MTATLWPVDPIDTDADGIPDFPEYPGRVLRQAFSAALAKNSTRPLGAISGVTPGTPPTTVTATPTTWTAAPHVGIIDKETAAEAGAYWYAFDAAVTRALTAADGAHDRIDLISVVVADPEESDGSTVPAVDYSYSQGVADGSLTVPAAPTRGIPLAQIRVPQATTGDPVVTWVAPYMAAAGGILKVSGPSQYPAAPYVGQRIDDESLGGMLRWDGSQWDQRDTDTGWVNTGISGAGANGISSILMRRVGPVVQISFAVTLSAFYASAISSGVTGNITNTTVATITDTRFRPAHTGPLGTGVSGVMLTGAVLSDGSVNVDALVGSITFGLGDVISFAGTYFAD